MCELGWFFSSNRVYGTTYIAIHTVYFEVKLLSLGTSLFCFYFHLFFFPAILLLNFTYYAQIFAHTKAILPTH